MDKITFKCGGCGREIIAPASSAGKHHKCPHCGQTNLVPNPAEQEEDILPLAPLDEEDERHMHEEVEHLLEQEKAILIEDKAEQPVPLEHREEIAAADLHHFVVNYCLDLANGKLDRAATHAAKLRKFGVTGKEAVSDFLTGKVLEPVLDVIPARVLQGFLTQLRDEISKE